MLRKSGSWLPWLGGLHNEVGLPAPALQQGRGGVDVNVSLQATGAPNVTEFCN